MNIETKIHVADNYGIRESAKEFPMMVVLSFIYLCNAGCPNCPYNNSDIRDTYKDAMIMPKDIFKRIADECGGYGAYLRLSGGGEPMLHPQAVELSLYAKDKGCKLGIISNGSVSNEKKVRPLIENNIDVLEFSVDAGNEQEYSLARPGLNWDILLKNVKAVRKIRDELNSETKIVCSIINQEGIDIDRAVALWENIVDKVQVRKFLTWGYNDNNSADDTPYLQPADRVPCPWLFERLNIDSRGDVTLCGEDIAFAEKFTNITERSIKDIWNGPEFAEWRHKHLERRGDEIKICSACPDWQYRSWQYNYWKIVRDADAKRQQ